MRLIGRGGVHAIISLSTTEVMRLRLAETTLPENSKKPECSRCAQNLCVPYADCLGEPDIWTRGVGGGVRILGFTRRETLGDGHQIDDHPIDEHRVGPWAAAEFVCASGVACTDPHDLASSLLSRTGFVYPNLESDAIIEFKPKSGLTRAVPNRVWGAVCHKFWASYIIEPEVSGRLRLIRGLISELDAIGRVKRYEQCPGSLSELWLSENLVVCFDLLAILLTLCDGEEAAILDAVHGLANPVVCEHRVPKKITDCMENYFEHRDLKTTIARTRSVVAAMEPHEKIPAYLVGRAVADCSVVVEADETTKSHGHGQRVTIIDSGSKGDLARKLHSWARS